MGTRCISDTRCHQWQSELKGGETGIEEWSLYILMKLSGYYFKVDCYRMLTVIPESPIRKYLKYTEKEMRWESKWYTTKNQLRGKKAVMEENEAQNKVWEIWGRGGMAEGSPFIPQIMLNRSKWNSPIKRQRSAERG